MTQEIKIKHANTVRVGRLHEDLETALGEAFTGLSTSQGVVHVFLSNKSKELERLAQDVVDAHDPSEPSTAEQRSVVSNTETENLRRADEPMTLSEFSDQPNVVRKLARKVLLLEAELRSRS